MGKKAVSIISVICLLLVLCSCSAKQEQALPVFVIGCDNYPPYSYIDEDGEPTGIDVDLAKEACRRMGYELQFQQIPWNEREIYLKNGKVDCLWSGISLDRGDEDIVWVGPYMHSRQVVAVLESSTIHSLSDLKDRTVAVKVGSDPERVFLNRMYNVPQVQDVYCLNDMDEVVIALANDYVDACAGYASSLTELLHNAGVNYRFLDEDLIRADLGIMFSKDGDPVMQEKLTKALEEMRLDGTMEHILQGYGLDVSKALGEGLR